MGQNSLGPDASAPCISVLMGVHNGADVLARAVDSILNQSRDDFELVLCDDASTDGTWALLEEYARRDKRVRLLRNGRNLGLGATLNRCLAEARGAYIARMDDDDFSHPQRFARQLDFLKAHPDVAFVGCNAALCRGGEKVGSRSFPEFPTVRDFYMTQPFLHPTLIFRREALAAVGGYSEDERCVLCEDYDLLLRLYAKGLQGANLQEILLDYTIPATAKGSRKMRHRWNEAVTRWRRFRELGALPRALPYVLKPLAVGLIPERALARLKGRNNGTGG